jgi:hypothetical protein
MEGWASRGLRHLTEGWNPYRLRFMCAVDGALRPRRALVYTLESWLESDELQGVGPG